MKKVSLRAAVAAGAVLWTGAALADDARPCARRYGLADWHELSVKVPFFKPE